jgi:hypothetical protein
MNNSIFMYGVGNIAIDFLLPKLSMILVTSALGQSVNHPSNFCSIPISGGIMRSYYSQGLREIFNQCGCRLAALLVLSFIGRNSIITGVMRCTPSSTGF